LQKGLYRFCFKAIKKGQAMHLRAARKAGAVVGGTAVEVVGGMTGEVLVD
jgi:hypothetical protein